MLTVPYAAKPVQPVYYAQYLAPDDTTLYGTAQETLYGWKFVDELGAPPFYTDRRAVVLCGEVKTAEQQRTKDKLAALWTNGMLRSGATVAQA